VTDGGAVDRPAELSLVEGLRTTGAVRDFQDRLVPHEVLARVFETARFAPNGGNQQAWHVVLVEDPELRRDLRDLYVQGWSQYLAMRAAGVQPWAPIGDREAEAAAISEADADGIGGFAGHFDEVPVMAVLLADLTLLAATDRDLGRYTLVGGASIYPFAWSVLLAAHAEGLGGVMTTMNVLHEPEVKALLRIPDDHAVAGVLALGYPVDRATRLRRSPVDRFVTIDRFDGPPLGSEDG
jgi:nitroreductase